MPEGPAARRYRPDTAGTIELIQPVVTFRRITFWYLSASAASPALSDIDLSIRAGTATLVCGPSGSGKSTLLRLCLGTVPQFSGGRVAGSIDVFGRDPTSTPPRELAALGVGLLFQNPTEGFVAERVVDEVAFGPENLGLPPAEIETRVAEALAAVDLSHVAYRRVRDLSSGEQQRVALAGVLALRPHLLLLDEPTAHLDETTAQLALELIRRIQHRHGLTLLLTEHRLGLAAPLVDRVLVLDGGRIVADGPPDTVFADPTLAERGVPVPRATQAGLRLGLKTLPLTADELADQVLAR